MTEVINFLRKYVVFLYIRIMILGNKISSDHKTSVCMRAFQVSRGPFDNKELG